MKVAIVITGLSTGGAETMLLRLLENIDRGKFSFHVISLTTRGEIGPRINALGVPVEALGMARGSPNPMAIFRLRSRLRELRVNLVHTWMYHADLLGGLAARAAGIRTVIWGIRNSDLDRHKTSTSTRCVVGINARLSKWLPAGILSCSSVARDVHVAVGYKGEKISVIPNGFDLAKFKPDSAARVSVREELGLPRDTPLIGVVGRDDPQKNHVGFLYAAALLRSRSPGVHFVFVGGGMDGANFRLEAAAAEVGVDGVTHFLGRRDDMPRLMASFDVLASSSSFGEAFPNVLGEAMACAVPCVVTDVGDSAFIVGETGHVVAVGDMPALAAGIEQMLALMPTERSALGDRARERVRRLFDIHDVARRYEDYYMRLAGTGS